MKIIFKKGKSYRKLFNYQRQFGSTTVFSPSLSVDAGFLDIEPAGNVNCTCFTVGKIASAETGKHYDYTWLWTQMVKLGKTSMFGASPQDAFATAVKGLKVVPSGEIDIFPAYFQVDAGQFDTFTNVKSAMQLEFNKGNRRPVGCGTQWYAEWGGVLPNGVMPEGKTHVTDHEWEVCGWDEEHPNCFKIDSHEGYYKYMPQDVFNKAFKDTYGAVGLTLAMTTQEVIDFNKALGYSKIQSAIDAIFNILKLIQNQIVLLVNQKTMQPNIPPVDVPAPIVEERVVEVPKYFWDTAEDARHSCRVIMDEEGLTYAKTLVDGVYHKAKDVLCACIKQESNFNNKAVGDNGTSKDWGIVQINDFYQIGPGKPFASVDEVVNNPDKAVRFMIKMYKAGKLGLWSSFSTGAFKKYL